jgi:hypothetical protein
MTIQRTARGWSVTVWALAYAGLAASTIPTQDRNTAWKLAMGLKRELANA